MERTHDGPGLLLGGINPGQALEGGFRWLKESLQRSAATLDDTGDITAERPDRGGNQCREQRELRPPQVIRRVAVWAAAAAG
jgi:hypothetical protein